MTRALLQAMVAATLLAGAPMAPALAQPPALQARPTEAGFLEVEGGITLRRTVVRNDRPAAARLSRDALHLAASVESAGRRL